ncbi:MAG TPA: dTMP kinase [Magnetococcales bacterium]|nr:dTMP kinase [Magnetococcales bacterium]
MGSQGGFVTFEGGDGVGKSTQAWLLAQRLEECGHRVVLTREPGGCPFSETLRDLLVAGQPQSIHAKTELLLMLAARVEHVRQLIQPALHQGQWVVSDRFFDSTLAYQGFGRGIDLSFLSMLNRWAIGDLVPHVTFLLVMDPQEGLLRAGKKCAISGSHRVETRFEREGELFQQRVNEGFIELARQDRSRFRSIDAGGSQENIAREIWATVKGVFPDVE